jgi:hypothetical protein
MKDFCFAILLAAALNFSTYGQTPNTSPLPAGETVIGGHLHAGAANEVWTDASALYFNYRGSASITHFWNGGNSAGSPVMSMLNSGKVGIGTASPQETLHVNGNIRGNINGALRISSGNGIVDIGAQNSGYAHFYTDRPAFFFGNPITVAGALNSYNTYDLNLQTNGTTRMTILNASGNVGVGISTPANKLHIKGDAANNAWISLDKSSSTENAGLAIRKTGTSLFYLMSDYNDSDAFKLYSNGVTGETSSAPRISFPYASANVLMAQSGGYVGIGTSHPDYPLTVNGTIHAKEVRVDLNVPAPDYVFENDYKLASLDDIKIYIDQNKHLPEVPSAKEMEKNGVQLGEMNMILLKKIEELTLHIIELKKEIDDLKSKK